ncbi:MAG: diguanylate cyclase [Lachnospiraceae bacterium]
MKKRLNIGLFVDSLDAVFTNEACKGAQLGAIAIDANMFVYAGGYLDADVISSDHLKYEYQYNTIFQFVTKNQIDVLYIMMGMIAGRIELEERVAFLERYLNIPIVLLYTRMEGYTSVIFDNRIGFKEAINHLLTDHGVTRLGFVSGPRTNVDAMERLDVYKEALKDAGIPYRDRYVVYGNFEESSEAIIRQFVEDNPELEGIAFANDRMAQGGYWAIEKLGIEIGTDFKVVSFDNSIFSAMLNPPLTTVEANAAELAYQAIVRAENFLETGKIDDVEIATHFVKRSSCGCHRFDCENLFEKLGFGSFLSKEGIQISKMHSYLFGDYMNSSVLQQLKDDLSVLIKLMIDMVKSRSFYKYENDIEVLFEQIIEEPIFQYTTVELLFNLLQSLQSGFEQALVDDKDRVRLMQLFAKMYRGLAISNCQVVQNQQAGMEKMSHLINNMTVGVLMMEDNTEIPFESILINLHEVGLKSSYLYTFQEPICHKRNQVFTPPKKLLLRAYGDNNGAFHVPLEKQLVSLDELYCNEYIKDDHRMTMVLSPLFSGEEIFGLLLCEVDYENFHNVAPVSFQLSSVIKSFLLLEKQQEIQRNLEINMQVMKKNNKLLDEMAKTDELTGLNNRRGFLEYTKNAIANPKNHGKQALIVYADMDNLKIINDEHGHDEGDFALREIAQILREAFRGSDVIGRYGGDEFVVFAIVGVSEYENIMKRRIEEITLRHSENSGKPYPIEMSTGICQFECEPSVNIYEKLDLADERLYEEKRRKHAGRR